MKFLKTLLVSMVALAVMAGPVFAFSDVDYYSDNYEAINYLFEEGVVEGYGDGTYKAENHISRAEFLKIVMEASAHLDVIFDQGLEGKNCYSDVRDEWFAKYVCEATKLGLVKGYSDGKFRPEQEVNFVEAAKIVVNAMDLEIPNLENELNWFDKYVYALENQSAIPKSISTFSYEVTRGDMAEIVWRINEEPENIASTNYLGLKRRTTEESSGGGLMAFESCVDLSAYLEENSQPEQIYYLEDTMMISPTSSAPMLKSTDSPDSVAAEAESSGASAGDADFSTTNVQVEGVDEADIVKTDGEYVYRVRGDELRVVKAKPAEAMVEMDAVTFDDPNGFYPEEMYVDGDRLVVLGSNYGQIWIDYSAWAEEQTMPSYSGSASQMYIFDISNPADVKLARKLSFEGSYSDSRKVDDRVYLVLQDDRWDYIDQPVPLYRDYEANVVEPVVDCGSVLYVPGVESSQYMVVAGVSINDDASEVSRTAVLGAGGEVYSSRENLYVAETEYSWWWDEGAEDEKTIIHKFGLGNEIEYKGKGEVPGTILNQFSMDENGGYFRVATTVGDVWNTEDPATNNLYVLNDALQVVGKVEGIAPGERIYSARFMGDRAYMVTFKKVDPFFVLDVSDPTAPEILGKLKIPGYSDYLHPYDENHIIGFGKDTIEAVEDEVAMRGFGFAWYQGMKVAMFDVTDVANPTELHKIVIGDRGTDSPLLYDHKALLFDKEKGIMAFPVQLAEITEDQKAETLESFGGGWPAYGDVVYQGAYVYDVSVENGFQLRGRVTHYDENEVADKSGDYWYGDSDVDRILYIGDVLYTVSQAAVMANKLGDLVELGRVDYKE